MLQSAIATAAPGALCIDWWSFFTEESNVSMYAVYMGCAILGGTILLIQILLLLFGVGDVDEFDFDADTDTDAGDSAGFLSIRALAGFFTFFGLAGMQGVKSDWHPLLTTGIALIAGLLMLFAIAWLMSLYRKLDTSGNLDPAKAVGSTGTVYLRIPASGSGRGKVTVLLQGREVQFEATTSGEGLPTGAACTLVRMTSPGTFEVEPFRATT